jgi:2-succinyl-5-enolpyruvyl-6-hydroxy-3-cyclohexene-1-carboxylate synthase
LLDKWVHQILQEIVSSGVRGFCLCPGKRNAPLIQALEQFPELKQYFWCEERSAAFFALGRARATGLPVAVLTTSGTAAAELLPAAMEACYSAVPLLLATADRPKRFRGSGAPQSAIQPGLYSHYASFEQDIDLGEPCDLTSWEKRGPAHLNICFEEPSPTFSYQLPQLEVSAPPRAALTVTDDSLREVEAFLKRPSRLLVVAGALPLQARQAVREFLMKLQAPVYLEATSGLRECGELRELKLRNIESIREQPIDAILRIGGVPTCRLWRDLEEMEGKVEVLSVSHIPFSGLSWGSVICTSLEDFFPKLAVAKKLGWKPDDASLDDLFLRFPKSEPALIRQLSEMIPQDARVYLGNSLPIREWDLAAWDGASGDVWASRGMSGIDGQLSTFFGLCEAGRENWAIVGDLTALYDLAAPWILPALGDLQIKIVVVNNGGGMIFSRLDMGERFTHRHNHDFSHFAKMWGLGFERWMFIPKTAPSDRQSLIELKPDKLETDEFWRTYRDLRSSRLLGAT